jgi:chitinase
MKLAIRSIPFCLLLILLLVVASGVAQNAAPAAAPLPPQTISLPTFTRSYSVGGTNYSYTLIGGDPAKGGTTTIPTVLVPITLTIEAPMNEMGKKAVLDASLDVPRVLSSPVFSKYAFASGATQYADAMMRTDFYSEGGSGDWHTLLGKPTVVPIKIDVPVGMGYVLTSKKTGRMLAMVDVRFIQQELFKQLPAGVGKLVIALTKDVTYYTSADATECCSWGTHGVDTSAGTRQPFVLGSYLDPQTVDVDSDVQPLTQQLAQFFRDPLHDPLYRAARGAPSPGNSFPGWMRVPAKTEAEQPRQNSGSGGTGLTIGLFLDDPTDVNWKNTVPASKAFVTGVGTAAYHLQNVALLQWYNQTTSPTSYKGAYSFPDATALPGPAVPSPVRRAGGGGGAAALPFGSAQAAPETTVQPVSLTGGPNGHHLIGYWSGLGPIRDVSPQWDIILVAFATPLPGEGSAEEGVMQYKVRGNMTEEQFKADIKLKQSQGKKVMISLRNSGALPYLATAAEKQNFIKSVEGICAEFGFDGIDIDFETRWGELDPGDTDFKHPTTPSTVNLIASMREIHDHFGPDFMLSLVPEGTQIPAAYPGYGGQFGSYIPIIEGIRDMLAFTDTQDYNCPPIEGLDGEYYMPGSVDYHAAATELVMHGFDVGRDPKHHFDPLPADKVIMGYLNSDTTPEIVADTMRFLITGKANTPTKYKMQRPTGYPTFSGAMFWTIDADRRENLRYSNVVGPLLHSYPPASKMVAGAAK